MALSPSLDVREREEKASSPGIGRMLAGCVRGSRIHSWGRAGHIMPESLVVCMKTREAESGSGDVVEL